MSTVLLNLTDISYTYFTHPILSGLNWEIQAGQKIGLIGANGGGKSTLLKIILGQLAPETGSIFRIKDLTIGYLPQDAGSDLPPFPPPWQGRRNLLPSPRRIACIPRSGRGVWGEVSPSSTPPCPVHPRSHGCAAPWPNARRRWVTRSSTILRRGW